MIENSYNDFRVGLVFSLLAHGVLFYCLLFMVMPRWKNLGQPVVYSITLEGGKSLGGIAQVPSTDKTAVLAPPKVLNEKASEAAKAKSLEEKNAEISLAEKKAEEAKKIAQQKKLEEEKKAAEKKKTEEAKKKAQEQLNKGQIDKQYQAEMQRYLGESTDAGGKGFGAGRLGGKSMGGGRLAPPEFFAYRDLLKRTIKQGWRWYDTSSSIKTTVYFEIARDGKISNIEMVESSGNREFDDSVVRAIFKASPVPPPPASVYDMFEKVRIQFDPTE